jgi:protein FrlC
MKAGIKFAQSSAVYFNYTLKHAIVELARLGYDGIEVWGGRPHAYRDDLLDEFSELKALASRLKLEICNFIPAQFRYPSLLCSDNERVRRDSIGYISAAMRNAKALGSPSISLCPGMVPWDRDLETGRKALMKSFREISEMNKDYRLRLLIEPAHRFESNLILTIDDCKKALDELSDPAYGVLLDVGHCHVNGEDLKAAVKLAGSYPLHIHLNDNLGDADSHLNLGEGNIDFAGLRSGLEEIGYAGYLSTELGAKYIMDPSAACRISLERSRKLFE